MRKPAVIILLLVFISLLISGCVATSKTEAKDAALDDCMARAKDCGLGLPAFEYELQSQCNKVYRIANSPEEITNVSKDFC